MQDCVVGKNGSAMLHITDYGRENCFTGCFLQCRAYSRALLDKKSKSPLFPKDGVAMVTNDWCKCISHITRLVVVNHSFNNIDIQDMIYCLKGNIETKV